MELYDHGNCHKCAEKFECLETEEAEVMLLSTDFGRRQIKLYESPELQAQFGRPVVTKPIRVKSVPGREHGTADYCYSCPLCGEFTFRYTDVPVDFEVTVGVIVAIPVDAVPEDLFVVKPPADPA